MQNQVNVELIQNFKLTSDQILSISTSNNQTYFRLEREIENEDCWDLFHNIFSCGEHIEKKKTLFVEGLSLLILLRGSVKLFGNFLGPLGPLELKLCVKIFAVKV